MSSFSQSQSLVETTCSLVPSNLSRLIVLVDLTFQERFLQIFLFCFDCPVSRGEGAKKIIALDKSKCYYFKPVKNGV